MKPTVRENCAYSLVSPTSMGVRITPLYHQPVHVSDHFFLQATSAESNVLTVSAALGERVKVLTTFVKDSPIAFLIKNDLRKRGVEFEGKDVPQGGPWGYRHQFNIADTGYGVRGPRVTNDRAGEVGRTLNVKDFDLENAWSKERTADITGLPMEVVDRKYKRFDPVPLETIYAFVKKVINAKQEMMKDPNSEIWVEDVRTGDRKTGVPKGASGQLGEAELEAIQKVLQEG